MKTEEMKTISKGLTMHWWAAVGLSLLVVVAYEMGWLLPGAWMNRVQLLFWVSVIMELTTVVLIPLALYLFKIPYVHTRLTGEGHNSQRGLLFWGTMRLAMLTVPMFLNTMLYYLFGHQVAFGYMAIILFLCLLMVYPSLRRCLAETEN